MAAKFAELWVEIGAKLDNFNRGMADVDKATQRMAKRLDRVGKQMTMRVTLPLLALGGAAVKMSADFDKGMTESLAIMDNVSPAMRAEMEKTAKQMSEESTFAAKELAGSYFFLASAGMDAAQSIKALPIVTKFAQAGTFDLATATDLLTDAQTALGLSSKNAEKNQKNLLRVSDVLVRANTLANASVRQFSESLTNRAAPALRMVGKDIEEGVAVLAAFADQGRKGGEAGEAFSIVLRDLQRAALGNEEAFKKAGVTVYDASGEMVNIADIIGDLEKLFEGMSDKQKKASMTILGFQERSQANILTLIGMSDKIRIYEKELRKAGGTTERVSKKQLEAFSNQMTVLKNKLMNVGIQIGDILIPIIKELVDDHIAPAVKWFSELSETSKTLAVKIAFLAAVMGPLVLMMGKLAKSFVAIRAAAPAVAAGFGPIAAGALLAYYASKLAYEVRDRYEGKLSKEEAARDAEIKQWQDLAKAVGGFTTFLENAEKAEVLTVEKRRAIWYKYQKEGPIAAFKAIVEGKEGPALQKFFIKTSGYTDETTEAMDKLEKEIKALLGAFDLFAGSEKKLLQLKEQMTDEYMQLTLDDYEYRKWAALQGYTDRLEILKKEKASDADFAMAKKVYETELKQIEKDQTAALREESEKRKAIKREYRDIAKQYTMSEFEYRMQEADDWFKEETGILEGLYGKSKMFYEAMKELWRAYAARHKATTEELYDTYEERLAGHKDVVKQYTMDTFAYQIESLDEWYEETKQSYKKAYGETELFYNLMLALQEEYNARRKVLEDEAKLAGLDAILAVANATANLFSQIGALSQTHFDNQMIALDKLTNANRESLEKRYEDEREAIENSVMSEGEKDEALKVLEEEKNEAFAKFDEDYEKKKKAIQKKAFESHKKISLVVAAINIAEAVTRALTGAIPPFNFILAGLVTAAGAIQLAAISAAKFPSAERGAWVPRPMPVMAGHGPKGEIIASPQKLKEMFAEMAPTTSPIQLEVNIYAKTLDRETVRQAGELIYRELEYQKNRGTP